MTVKTVLKRNKNYNWVKIYQQQKLSCGTIKSLISNCPIYCYTGDEYFSNMTVLAYGYDLADKVLEIWVK